MLLQGNKRIVWFVNVLLISMAVQHAHRCRNRGFALAETAAAGEDINRGSFPQGFVFGTATSAYQYEGAVKEDGRGTCIWDKFAHSSGKILDFSNADVALDHYHRYHEDIQLMKDMGMDTYRFSISWSRIFPNGTGQINQAGVDFYSSLIDALLAKGIEPYVTMFHWDTPQALEDRYNGWLSPQIINDFGTFADTLFEKFGDRVKHWITLNEPYTYAIKGYDKGIYPPERCSILLDLPCSAGNSSTEPYIVAHNLLLAHATAAHIYREKYQAKQGGSIGATFDVMWYEPSTNTTDDIEAAQRAMDFQLGWFLDPIMFDDYPSSMRERVGKRLPKFSADAAALVKGSLDFVGINHYTSKYAKDSKFSVTTMILQGAHQSDSGSTISPIGHDLKPIGPKANSAWLYIVPWGMRRVMNYIKNTYGNPTVFITENGMDDPDIPLMPRSFALNDNKRIQYHHDYLQNLAAAINEDGCNVKGYFAWSLLDNWEWESGYSSRFGLYYIDRNDNLKRYPKDSVAWFKNFLTSYKQLSFIYES